MCFIVVAIINRNLAPLTYYTHDEVVLYDIMQVSVRNKMELGIIVQIISNQNFEFEILEAKKSHFRYTQTQRILLPFMSAYYIQSIGITAQVFTPKDMRLESNIHSSGLPNFKLQKNEDLESNHHIKCKQTFDMESKYDRNLDSTPTNHANKTTNSSNCSMALEALIELEGRSYLNDNDYPSNSINRSNCIDKGEFLQNLDSNNFAPLHPAPTHLDKNLDSKNYALSPVSHLDLTENVESNLPQTEILCNLKTLSNNQQEIFTECSKRSLSLIFGTTGSGKTEIYFHAIAKTLKEGKQALLLMPEISLTPQMQERLNTAFPNLADTWHSKRTATQKQKILQSLQNGSLKIIAGARSALFLPFENLGLIIVDEEHDDSYKSQSNPKYHARDLAIFLSTKGIQVILGSATPSPKSYYLAKKHNYLLHLQNKFHNSTQTLHYDESEQIGISLHILHAITSTLEKGEQVIIFLPTRANFKILLCRTCKQKILCPNCSITLSLHSKKNALVCHYCNFTSQIPRACNTCGSDMLSGVRMGTEEFKKELETALLSHNLTPNIAIFDRDNVSTQKKLTALLHDFGEQKIDILIGTQMIAKGHDYPNVTLSIIIGMDYMLQIPDYRAHETSFSLLYQVAGRSGRKKHGNILVQTKDFELINNLWGDYTKVLHYILHERNPLYPPFCRLALLRFGHSSEKKAHNLAKEFASILHKIQCENDYAFEIVGVSEASIFKIKKKYYYQILLRSYNNLTLQKALQHALKYATKDIKNCVDIDIDPLSF